MAFSIGDRVKPSGYVTNRARDYWQGVGREPMKSGAKREFERVCALRGTVTAITPNEFSKSAIEVTTDDGAVHKSLDYRWESA